MDVQKMSSRRKMRLGDLLIAQGVITEEQLQTALSLQRGTGRKLGEVMVDENIATEEAIAEALSNQLGLPYVHLAGMQIPETVVNLVSFAIAEKYVAVPYKYDENNANILWVAMADPMDMAALDDFAIITNLQIMAAVATRAEIKLLLDKYYGEANAQSVADQYLKDRQEVLEVDDIGDDDVSDSPIVQLVKNMIDQAVRLRTSDIHIEPMENQVRVRYRIDGALYEKMKYSPKLLPAITARIKIIGGMDISEKRKPQDGRITQVVDRKEFDIRVSILPTVYGEKTVMRLTSKTNLTREKSQLGFNKSELAQFDHILRNPHGIILVTGPTGSGKSTTLYTALSELNTEDVNIITVEDPVEANIDGINQVHVNAKAGLTFASALRSILRQDPDIIMIGEIRDGETAGIAVQASITGHLVVSTLHTNSTAASISRLMDMGIESYLLADSVVGIIAQRLVRRLCPKCKRATMATDQQKEILGLPPEAQQIVYEPGGCPECDNNGYKGRIGVYEIMEVTQELKPLISRKASSEELKEAAIKQGMNTLKMSATRLVYEGITSVSEMVKVSFDS